MYWILPLNSSPRQVFTLALSPDGAPLNARVEVRYLPAPEEWVLSLWDADTDTLLVSGIPLIASHGTLNDLLKPFGHLRNGKGLGSLFCLRAVDAPASPDPKEKNLEEFQVLWGDTVEYNNQSNV